MCYKNAIRIEAKRHVMRLTYICWMFPSLNLIVSTLIVLHDFVRMSSDVRKEFAGLCFVLFESSSSGGERSAVDIFFLYSLVSIFFFSISLVLLVLLCYCLHLDNNDGGERVKICAFIGTFDDRMMF